MKDHTNEMEFLVMDALRRLEFPVVYFDLVNQRAGASYLRTWDWPNLLQEYQRVTHIGGIIRLTEGEWAAESSSPALTHLFELLIQAFYRAGHSFTQERDGVTKNSRRCFTDRAGHPHNNRSLLPNTRLAPRQAIFFEAIYK